MGGGMARNLLAARYYVMVCDVDSGKVAALVSEGASAGTAPREVVEKADITFLSLPTSGTCVSVMEDPDSGVLPGLAAGKVVIDTGTTSAPETRRIAERIRLQGADLMDAPVSGGRGGAEKGTLAVMVGGVRDTFNRCRPVLDVIGGSVVHVGDVGCGQVVKAVNQIAMGVAQAAFLEAIFLGTSAGIQPGAIWEALRTAGAVNTSFQAAARQVSTGRAEAQDLKLRELPYFVEEAVDRGISLPLTEALLGFASRGENRTQDPLGIPTPSYWYELNHRRRE